MLAIIGYDIVRIELFIMDQNLITAIAGLIGALIGSVSALLGGVITHHLQEKSNTKLDRRKKIEEIYIYINQWINSAWGVFMDFSLVFNKASTWDEYLDKIIALDNKKELSFYKIEITINLYFKELIPDYTNLVKAVQDLFRYINSEIKSSYLSGSNISVHRSVYNSKLETINKIIEILNCKIQKMAKET
jgi:hypothetical protein